MAAFGALVGALPAPENVEEQARVFVATNTLLFNNLSAAETDTTAISPSQVQLFVTTGEVPIRAAAEINFDGNAATLASQVETSFDEESGALLIATQQESAAQAELVANTFADELDSYLTERQDVTYQARLASSIERLATLETQLREVTQELAIFPDDPLLLAKSQAISRQYSVVFEQEAVLQENPPTLGFTTLQRAEAVETTDRGIGAPTSRLTRGLLGMLVGAALGIGVALVLGQLDRRLRTREQAETAMDMRARVLIPKVRDRDRDQLIVQPGRHDPLSDAYRTVRNVVGFVQGPADPTNDARITLVVSPGPGDGKTSLAANLAAAMAESGQRTILVNTDFRRPRLASALNAERSTPAPFTMEVPEHVDLKSLLQKTDQTRLLLMDLSSFDGSAGELVRATISTLPNLSKLADSIVIDSSPVGATAEVLELVPHADVIVVLARIGHTAIAAAQRTVAILRDLATAPMVLVLSGMKLDKEGYYEYTDRHTSGSGLLSRWRDRRNKPSEVDDEQAAEEEPELEPAE